MNVPAGSGKFLRTVQSWIQIDNIYTPLESGMYVFNINTYSENYDFLESGTAYAYMIASNFSAFNCFAYHAAVSTPTIIDI